MLKKILYIVVPWLIVFLLAIFLWKNFKGFFGIDETKTVVTHHVILDKIEAIGKLEAVKFYIKDIVEHTESKQWWPDPKAVLIISGEVVGCIDLKKMDSNSIVIANEFIRVRLPDPEICYSKIDHQQSKVYHLENEIFDQAGLIDKAYKLAEKQLYTTAMKMKLLDQTRTNAEALLKPLIENMSGKKVLFVH